MKILKNTNLDDVLFLDIETVRIVPELNKDTPLYDSWEYKLRYSAEADKFGDSSITDIFLEKAPLYAEFGKIVCITIGRIHNNKIQLKSYYNDDEKVLLQEFTDDVNSLLSTNKNIILSGFAITGFDIPYIMRRCLINRVELSPLFDTAHLKPWELKVLDIKDLWKGTGWYSASLINVSTALGLPSPKSDINGSETSDVYYNEKDGIERIKKYCEKDVETVINIFLVLRGDDIIESVTNDTVSIKSVGTLDKLNNSGKLNNKEQKHIVDTLSSLTGKEKEIAKELLEIVTKTNK